MMHFKRFSTHLSEQRSSNYEIELIENSYGFEQVPNCIYDKVHTYRDSILFSLMIKIPVVRKFLVRYLVCKKVKILLKQGTFSLVNIHCLQPYTDEIVRIAHKNNVKVLLTPYGSDFLRAKKKNKERLLNALKEADNISCKKNSSFSRRLQVEYGIAKDRFVVLPYGSDVISLIVKNRNNVSREVMSDALHIPYSNYNICCGYNAQKSQQHTQIIRALASIKKDLPKNYQIIFPLTYGDAKFELKKSLRQISNNYGLKIVFLDDFLCDEHVSYLRLITDLFIHVQTTDATNSSIQEYLLGGAQCINGSWLSYPALEEKGLPYYQCKKIEDLSTVIKRVITNKEKPISLHPEIIKLIEGSSWNNVIKYWDMFYKSL